MDTFFRFLYEFLQQFFSAFILMFKGIFNGIIKMFDIKGYIGIINFYKNDFNGPEWVLVSLAILCVVVIIGGIILLIYFLIRKYIRFRKTVVEQESLLEEVADLNNQVADLMNEKESILAMKVSQLGLKPGEDDTVNIDDKKDENVDTTSSRFPKLTAVDNEYANYKIQTYGNSFTLEELVETFRNFAASQLKLYYKSEMIRLFISALASTKLVILQGISGTGKTSLAYAWGKFLKHDSCVASVQPSWRDRTELFGYFNEFTKKFNETEILEKMYEAHFNDEIYLTLLDEMNISRVEYYFAEMLSILELPNKKDWKIELVPNVWPNDPKKLEDGKLQLPENMWYVGTINNDDSTFMITDKVYDRAMPIAIDDKCEAFEALDTEPLKISYKYLDNTFKTAMKDNQVSEETLDKVAKLDRYVIDHFRLSFGNRIVKQLREFVPVFVGCGGTEVAGIDYVIAHKILRKFEQLNLAYIKDEIDGLISYLEELFGKDKMPECKAYLLRLKKTI